MTYYVFWLSRPCSYCPITKKNWVGRSTWFYKQIEQLEIYHIIYSVICNCWNHSPMIEAWQFFITAKSTSPLSPPTMKVSGASERCSLKKYHTGKKFCQLPWIINTAWQLLAKQLNFLSEEWGPPAPLEIITHDKEHWKQRLTSFIKLKFIWKWSCFDATTVMDSRQPDLLRVLSLWSGLEPFCKMWHRRAPRCLGQHDELDNQCTLVCDLLHSERLATT